MVDVVPWALNQYVCQFFLIVITILVIVDLLFNYWFVHRIMPKTLTSIYSRSCLRNYTPGFIWDVIAHPCLTSAAVQLNMPRFPIAEPSHSPIDWGEFSWGRVFSKDANRGSETVQTRRPVPRSRWPLAHEYSLEA